MRRTHVLVGATALLFALTACGAGDKPDTEAGGGAKVATLTSPGPSAAAASSVPAQRPRERLDTTTEEFESMLAPYNKCLKDKGYNQTDAKRAAAAAAEQGAATGPIDSAGPEAQKMDEAYRICEAQFYPLPPWEKDPANPEARDFAVAVVKCLKERGIEYVEVSDDGISIALGGDQNDSRSISRGLDLAPDCEREVAAATK